MKKVLLTNFKLINYTGSELDTLTVANYFLDKNYDVTIYTLEYGYPILNEVNSKIKIIDCIHDAELDESYDLIWSHHYPLLDYLIFGKLVKAKHIAYISLSSYEPYEKIPEYYSFLDFVSILSQEGFNVLQDKGYNVNKIKVFTNYSFEKYFKSRKRVLNEKIRKICVVSNHVPDEILKFKVIAEKNDIKVDIYGKQFKYVSINEKLLKNYDVIITIGKTVNYAISLGIPVYCYDIFGGDGYITKKNIQKSYEYNFSGRYKQCIMTGTEIFEDIVKNYLKVLKDIDYLYSFGLKKFCFENNMNECLKQIFSHNNDINIARLLHDYSDYGCNAVLFVREIQKLYFSSRHKDCYIKYFRVYCDYGNGFKEDGISVLYPKLENDKYFIKFCVKRNVKKIRIYISHIAYTMINYFNINGRNLELSSIRNVERYNKKVITVDGNAFIDYTTSKISSIKIEMQAFVLHKKDFINDIRNLEKRCNDLLEEKNIVTGSRWFKMINKVRVIMGKDDLLK